MLSGGHWEAVLLVGLLSLWLAATVVNSTARGFRRLGGHGFHHFLPRWNFFAPNPGQEDYHLLYRDQLVDGGITPWQETAGFQQPRDVTAAIWNPQKHGKKALFDLTQELLRLRSPRDAMETEASTAESLGDDELVPVESDAIKLTTAYIALLNYVSSAHHSEMALATQFVILRESGHDGSFEPVFLSDFHNI